METDYTKKQFKQGDFITYNNKKGSFAIYEGRTLSETKYLKTKSVIAWFDPADYQRTAPSGTYGYKPTLDVATYAKKCNKTVDTETEDTWWRICTEEEKKDAIQILNDYGYDWDDTLQAIVMLESREVVRTMIDPKIEYHGEVIKPMGDDLKLTLKTACLSKNKSYSYGGSGYPNYGRDMYEGYYDGCYDD